MRRFRRGVSGLAVAALMTTCVVGSPANAAASDHQKHVLVLNSTRHDEQFSVVSEREMPKLLAEGLGEDVDYYTEYFDALRFPQPEFESAHFDFLRRKYAGRPFDLLILMGDIAIDFMATHRDVLFAGTPVVFYSLNPPSHRPANATGVINELRFKGSIDLALALQPDLEHVFVVSGASEKDRFFERRARADFESFGGRVAFTYLSGLATRDLEQRLRTLPPRSAVYYVVVSQDATGESFQQMSYLARVAAAANAPTYSWADAAADSGIVGGSRRDHQAQVKAIAALALRVLRGERPDDIPVAAANTDVDQVDWRQLRRWHISESRLPAGARLMFREPSAWDRYKRYIVGAIALIGAQSVLIVGLLFERSRRRHAEIELRGSEAKLRVSYERIRHLGRRLLGEQEAERARVARELHDDISQQLAILSIDLDAIGADLRQFPGATRLSQALARAHGISTSLHELSHRLHPAKLQLVGLVAALDSLQRGFSRPHLSPTFSHRDVPMGIDHDIALCVYRVAQEALQNVAKHSGASRVWLELTGGGANVALTVVDDGKGFDVEGRNGDGLGLISIRERVESVGGILQIQSTPGQGTRLSISVPIHAPAATPAAGEILSA